MRGTLAGLRVLDLSRLLPGPFLTQLFAELGADVVKIEAPGIGDEARIAPYAFEAVNAGKRSVVVDLKRAEGRDVVLRLASKSDVLVENFRPGAMERLGLSDDALSRANPRLVRCSLVGYPAGELRDDAGHDLNYQATAGILALAPGLRAPPAQVADIGGALYAATAILAALLERERTGQGRRIEIALVDAALAFNTLPLARARGGEEGAGAWELTGTIPCYRTYACSDGKHVALGALETRFFERFAEATGVGVLLQYDPAGHAVLEALFATRTADGWVATLRKASVPISRVLAPDEVRAPAGPATPLVGAPSTARAPELNEHAEAVLREAGYSAEEIGRLRAAGILAP